eukprot:2309941-Alexandrium_andersonii.AAC.1
MLQKTARCLATLVPPPGSAGWRLRRARGAGQGIQGGGAIAARQRASCLAGTVRAAPEGQHQKDNTACSGFSA